MSTPRTTIWPMDAHTPGKHIVLRNYLDGWLPILASRNERMIFIDCFAGPGRYSKGEIGSPVVAARAIQENAPFLRSKAQIRLRFIEENKDRAAFLQSIVEEMRPTMPAQCLMEDVTVGKFDQSMAGILDDLDRQMKPLDPAFVMVDPFGFTGTPMSMLHRILRHDKSELYISVMWDFMNRFVDTPRQEVEPSLTELFGTEDWKQARLLALGGPRKDFLFGLYEQRLRDGGAKYVVHFDLFCGNKHVYSIFFASKHRKGCDLMKAAIWRAVPWGDYAFRGSRAGQESMELQANLAPLRHELRAEFGTGRFVPIEELEGYMMSDRTDYYCGQLRDKTLKPMEVEGHIEVRRPEGKRRGYTLGTELRFLGHW